MMKLMTVRRRAHGDEGEHLPPPSPSEERVGRRNHRRSLGGTAFVSMVIAMIMLALLLPARAFATNGGDPHQGTPPCDQQSTSQHNLKNMYDPRNGRYMGYAYIVYSSGCQTEWVTVHAYSPYAPIESVWMQNQSGTSLDDAITSNFDNSGVYWTNQLTNMRYQTACGGTHMYDASSGQYVNWNYLGCY
jgi:hypothetical protein